MAKKKTDTDPEEIPGAPGVVFELEEADAAEASPAKPRAATHADDLQPRLYTVTRGPAVSFASRPRLLVNDHRGEAYGFAPGASKEMRLLPPVARQLAGEGWGVAVKE